MVDRARDNRGIPGGQALRGRGSALREVRHSHPCRHGEGGFNQSEPIVRSPQPIKTDLQDDQSIIKKRYPGNKNGGKASHTIMNAL
jgi:hypothetical protein